MIDGNRSEIYLDHAATTPIAPEAFNNFAELLKSGIANSSSAHRPGATAAAVLQRAREIVAKKLGSKASEIVFCSGGTEANNWVLQRTVADWKVATKNSHTLPHIITASTEHSSVANTAARLRDEGLAEWSEVQVDPLGYVDIKGLARLIKPTTALVSISHGNNEIGTIQDLHKIGSLCREHGVRFHADACQSFCHVDYQIDDLPVDLMTLSGHKVRGPKGVGALYIRQGVELSPLIYGGKQERGLRPGTTSVELISAFASATQTWSSHTIEKILETKAFAIQTIRTLFPRAVFNGEVESQSLCHVLSFTIPGHESKVLHQRLAENGVACSTGAACGTGKSDRSAVLLALGREPQFAHQLRFSFSPTTSHDDVREALSRLEFILASEQSPS